jgi:hypothetical protein
MKSTNDPEVTPRATPVHDPIWARNVRCYYDIFMLLRDLRFTRLRDAAI